MSQETLDKYSHLPKVKAPFKNHLNQRYTKQLFYELWCSVPSEERVILPVFTLNSDIPGLTNFGREYVKDEDPSGYTTALRLLKEYDHWKVLMKVMWFIEAKKGWDEEIDAKLYAKALAKIVELAKGDDAKALTAAKFLANKQYKVKRERSAGRPSKDEIEGATREALRESSEIADDLARIRVIK